MMEDVMLILSVLFMFGVGFFIMGKLDDFLNENIRELEEKQVKDFDHKSVS